MADKEERILIAHSIDYTLTDTDKGELCEGKIAPGLFGLDGHK